MITKYLYNILLAESGLRASFLYENNYNEKDVAYGMPGWLT